MNPDYRLTRFYEDDGADTPAVSPIFAELQGLEDRYSKPQVIAQGGLKQILRVFDNTTSRYVAMAQLRSDAPEELFDPFLREARLTALLEHPNIIAVHDVGVGADERPYFTMELKTGASLGEIVKQLGEYSEPHLARYTREHLLEIFLKICDAVSFAHAKRVLHLDLKPDNIQIGDYGEVIVCDWGLGKIIGSEEKGLEFDELLLNPDLLNNMTLAGTIKGTLGYMAPEQVDDQQKTERTDIYALGAILYAILSHATPIEGEKETVFERTRKGGVIPPRLRSPELDIPQSLDAVAMRAMALAPGNRYARVEDLSREIRKYLSGFATEAEHAGVGKQLQLVYLRNQRFFNTLGAGVLAVALVATLSVRQIQEKKRLATEARERAEKAQILYLEAKGHLADITDDYLADLINMNHKLIQTKEFDYALAKIEQATRKDPKNLTAWQEKGNTQFVMQQFNASEESFKHAGISNSIYKLALEYAKRKPDNKYLTGTELAGLIRRIEQKPLRLKMMMFDSMVRKDRSEHALVVRALVELANPDWKDGRFDYDPVAHSLLLSGSGLRMLNIGITNSGRCALSTLDLRSLDLRGTEFSNLKDIKGLEIETLDLRDTAVLDLSDIKKLKYLRKLTVSPDRYPKGAIRAMRKQMDVVVAP